MPWTMAYDVCRRLLWQWITTRIVLQSRKKESGWWAVSQSKMRSTTTLSSDMAELDASFKPWLPFLVNTIFNTTHLLCREKAGKTIMDEGGLAVILSALANHRHTSKSGRVIRSHVLLKATHGLNLRDWWLIICRKRWWNPFERCRTTRCGQRCNGRFFLERRVHQKHRLSPSTRCAASICEIRSSVSAHILATVITVVNEGHCSPVNADGHLNYGFIWVPSLLLVPTLLETARVAQFGLLVDEGSPVLFESIRLSPCSW